MKTQGETKDKAPLKRKVKKEAKKRAFAWNGKSSNPEASWLVKIGTGLKNSSDFHDALTKVNCTPGERVKKMIDKVQITESPDEVRLILITCINLGFNYYEIIPRKVIIEKILASGLQLCTIESALELRRQFDDRSLEAGNHMFSVAMEPVEIGEEHPCFFSFINGACSKTRADKERLLMAPDTRFDNEEGPDKGYCANCEWLVTVPKGMTLKVD